MPSLLTPGRKPLHQLAIYIVKSEAQLSPCQGNSRSEGRKGLQRMDSPCERHRGTHMVPKNCLSPEAPVTVTDASMSDCVGSASPTVTGHPGQVARGFPNEKAFKLSLRWSKLLKSGSRWDHPGQRGRAANLGAESVSERALGSAVRGGGCKAPTTL